MQRGALLRGERLQQLATSTPICMGRVQPATS